MQFCSKIAIFAFAWLILCLPRLSMAQTYSPDDWSGPTLAIFSFDHSETGDGETGVAEDGSMVYAVTATDGDYAYATATCAATFAHLVAQNEDFYCVFYGAVSGIFRTNGYGHSSTSSGNVTIVSDSGQNHHNYSDSAYNGAGPLSVSSTQTEVNILFTVTAQCHDGYARVVALGDVDKNTD